MLQKALIADIADMFQSAPGREAGRCAAPAVAPAGRIRCFNPRPAVRPGDADIAGFHRQGLIVSIRARP